ncbi:MAG: two-component system sensor histidine kinase NtrB, partial [Bryobacteraceae bacterium]
MLAQAVVITGPLLYAFSDRVERWKQGLVDVPERSPATPRQIVVAISSGGVLLAALLVASGHVASLRISAALSSGNSATAQDAVRAAARIFEMASWTGVVLIVAAAFAAVMLARGWMGSLHEQVSTLAETTERFRATFEHAAVGIAHIDPQGSVLRINKRLLSILGCDEEHATSTNCFDFTHPEDRPRAVEAFQRVLAGEVPSSHLEKKLARPDGTLVWVEQTLTLARDDAGNPSYLVCIMGDLTEQRRLEDELRQAQKMEAIGRLAGGIAHDFNNLLTAIIGYSELVLAKFDKKDPAWARVNEIYRAGERAAALTRQLLAFSRRQVTRPKQLDLNTVVQNLDTMLRRLIGSNIQMEVNLAPDLGKVMADPTQLEQIVMNLVVNARDAMPKGGTLKIETSNVDVDAPPDHPEASAARDSGSVRGPHVMLSVQDNGMGMDQETLSHLFEPFFTTKETGKGTGLGLSTVYGVVK